MCLAMAVQPSIIIQLQAQITFAISVRLQTLTMCTDSAGPACIKARISRKRSQKQQSKLTVGHVPVRPTEELFATEEMSYREGQPMLPPTGICIYHRITALLSSLSESNIIQTIYVICLPLAIIC